MSASLKQQEYRYDSIELDQEFDDEKYMYMYNNQQEVNNKQ
jgi:hypothetical protein